LKANDWPYGRCHAFPFRAAQAAGGDKMTTNSRVAIFGSVFAVLVCIGLLAIGRAHEQSKPAENNRPSNLSVPIQAAVTPAATVPARPELAKKHARRRPSTVAYSDHTYGVSFRYPRNYTLKSGDDGQSELAELGPVPLNFVQPGGITVVSVEAPSGSYPKTDLTSALLNVNVNRSMTQEECSQFAMAKTGDSGVQPNKVKVGGREFDEMEVIGEEGNAQGDVRYYHLYENGACYEFTLALGTTNSSEMEGISPVNRDTVFARLVKILSTVKIEEGPEVAVKPSDPVGSN
jgi:hypothetical protein